MTDLEAIAGTWQIEFDTPDSQTIKFEFQVTVKDKKIKVEYLDAESVDVKKAKYKNGTLTIETDQEYQSAELEVTYLLELDGDEITGSLEYLFVDQEQEGELELEGKRIK